MTTFGERLKLAIKEKGTKSSYICNQLGIPEPTMSGYANDRREPELETIMGISKVLGVRAGWLAFGELPQWVADDKEIIGPPTSPAADNNHLPSRVEALETDMRLIKKLLTKE